MIDRQCCNCGYDLAGLPRPEGVIACPECGHRHVPLDPMQNVRIHRLRPYLWGMIPPSAVILGVWLLPSAMQFRFADAAGLGAIALGAWITARTMNALLVREDFLCQRPRSRPHRWAVAAAAGTGAIVLDFLILSFGYFIYAPTRGM